MRFCKLDWFGRGAFAVLLASGVIASAQGRAPSEGKVNSKQAGVEAEKDDPIGRAKWFNEWFGPATPEYLDYKIQLAEQEIQKWGHLIPGTPAYVKRAPFAAENGMGRAGIPARHWFEIGPYRGHSQVANNVYDANIVDTGRPTVILPHPTNPNLIYVGFAGGGLWHSANANLASNDDWVWEPLTDALPGGGPAGNQSVGSAAFKPEDPSTIYLALGDMMSGSSTAEGRGFFISNDGGVSWIRGGTLGGTTRVKTVLALSGNIVLVAGNRGLFRSIDGGMNFTRITSGPLQDGTGVNYAGAAYGPNSMASCWDIIQLQDGSLVLTYQFFDTGYGVYGGGGVAYSADNGVTWTKATMGPGFSERGFGRIAIAASGSTLYGLYMNGDVPTPDRIFPRALMKSTDGGRSWIYQAAPSLFSLSGDGDQTRYNHMIAVDPDNPNSVFVGTNFSLYRSLDGGLNFSQMTSWIARGRQYTHADLHISAWAPSGPKTLYIGTDGGVSILRQPYISPIPSASDSVQMVSDPSVIDHRRNRNIATQLVYNIGSTTADTPPGSRDRVIAGFQDLGTRLRTESTAANGAYNTVIGGDGFGCLIHPYNGNLMLGSLYYTRVQRSSNGANFSQSVNGITGAGDSGAAPFNTRLIHTMADPTGNRVYTYTNTTPYVSDDFGASWRALPISGNGWPGGNIRSFGASNLKLGLIGATFDATVGTSRGRVAISEDNGNTWRTFTGFPGGLNSMSDIAFDTADPNVIYVSSVRMGLWNIGGSEGGLTANHMWKTTDGGLSWSSIDGSAAISNGFPFGIPVHVVKVDPIDNNTVYAGTDFGLYRSTNQGAAWERFGDGLPMVSVRDIYIAPDGSFMRVGTHGRGIWEMQGVTDSYAPKIIAHPLLAATSVGSQITLSVGAVAIPAPTYQWQVSTNDGSNWTDITGATGRTYTTTLFVADSGKQFRAVAINPLGNAVSNAVLFDASSFMFDIDGVPGVDVYDLLKFMSLYGSTNAADLALADFNSDGGIDDADLALILDAF